MNWGPLVGVIGSWLAALSITGAVAAGAAWGLFQWLGKKWVEDHFSRELEAFKAEKQSDLETLRTEYVRQTERLKADLNRFADRASRFHLREYEVVLPEAWGFMNKAYGAASTTISHLRHYPDLNSMRSPQFEAWLEQSKLEEYQRDELRSASNKNDYYIGWLTGKEIAEAEQAAIDFTNYVILQGIFIEESLSAKMMEAGQNIRKALISRNMVERMKGQPYRDGQTDFWDKAWQEIEAVGQVVLEVKEEIRSRLSNIRLEE